MKLKITPLSQRDSRWASILLGYNTSNVYTIGMYGCLITCLSAITNRLPNVTNQILKDNSGYVSGGNFVWSKCTALGLNQIYSSSSYTGPVTDAGVAKAKELLNQQHPLLCEIDFNPATIGEEMHYVEIIGYEGDNFYIMDPWTGEIVSMDRYGGFRRATIQFRAYDKTLPIEGVVTPPPVTCDPNWRIERDDNWRLYEAEKQKVADLQIQLSQAGALCQTKLNELKEKIKNFINTV